VISCILDLALAYLDLVVDFLLSSTKMEKYQRKINLAISTGPRKDASRVTAVTFLIRENLVDHLRNPLEMVVVVVEKKL